MSVLCHHYEIANLHSRAHCDRLYGIEINRDDIIDNIDRDKCNKSPVHDGMYAGVLKDNKEEIAGDLLGLHRKSLRQAAVRSDGQPQMLFIYFTKGITGFSC